MSAKRLAMRAMPLGRSVVATAALRGPCIAGRQRFTTSLFRRAAAGSHREPRAASVWSLSNVCAVAVTAGLMGWGASELRHGGFPGTMLLDGGLDTPRYASMREMEQVCCAVLASPTLSGGMMTDMPPRPLKKSAGSL